MTLTCTKCREALPEDEFHRNKRAKSGRVPWCKSCTTEYQSGYYQRNRENILARQSAYERARRKAAFGA